MAGQLAAAALGYSGEPNKQVQMADAGEGLIDAQNRIQERMDEREEERARRAMPQGDRDPEQLRRTESLRLAYTELSRQLEATTHTARRQQLSSALAELERQLKALGARPH